MQNNENTVNIKDNNPTCDYAIYLMETAFADCAREGVRVVVLIHGYGSSGKGGVIKSSVRKLLKIYKKQAKITTFVGGEEWGHENKDKQLICSICPQVILNSNLQNLNSGVTVVLLNE